LKIFLSTLQQKHYAKYLLFEDPPEEGNADRQGWLLLLTVLLQGNQKASGSSCRAFALTLGSAKRLPEKGCVPLNTEELITGYARWARTFLFTRHDVS